MILSQANNPEFDQVEPWNVLARTSVGQTTMKEEVECKHYSDRKYNLVVFLNCIILKNFYLLCKLADAPGE